MRTVEFELGPETRKLIRGLTGGSHSDDPEIIEWIVQEYEDKLKTQREQMEAEFEVMLGGEFKPPGGEKRAPLDNESLAALERLREKAKNDAEALHTKKLGKMPDCMCGCGRSVLKRNNKFIHGHGGGRKGKDRKGRSLKLKHTDLAILKGKVKCPKSDELTDAELCHACGSIITRLKDPVTGARFVRCAKASVARE